MKLEMVIILSQAATAPYSVLSWREAKPDYQPPQSADADREQLNYGR